ncbi:amino acid permease, partial [Francisella tularensis subsp. holarctica]|nr:amino acid permease [Francisella tularensis subsp. holarctica]
MLSNQSTMGINRSVTPYKQELAKKLNLFHLIA